MCICIHMYMDSIYYIYTSKYKYNFILGSSIIAKIFMTNSVISIDKSENTSLVILNLALYS